MAVKIRLKRMGAKKKPFYRIVVADSRVARDGRAIEELGHFDPLKDPAEIKVDGQKALYWISKGAQPTETVKALLKKAGVYDLKPEVAAEVAPEIVSEAAAEVAPEIVPEVAPEEEITAEAAAE